MEADIERMVPDFAELEPAEQEMLRAMAHNMRERGLPETLVETGLCSTAALLLEQRKAAEPRVLSEPVQRFIEENAGRTVAKSSPRTPRREAKAESRDALRDRLYRLLGAARTARRPHEVKRLRREVLAVDSAFVRRVLGEEGDAICAEFAEWLAHVSRDGRLV